MKAVIVQSAFIPWLGFFDMLYQADKFVFYDDVQYTTRDWRNRNRICIQTGWRWLSVPVALSKSYFEYKVCEVPISYDHDWVKEHLDLFKEAYGKALYFSELYPLLERILVKRPKFLIDLNYALLFAICEYLGINTEKIMFSQKMDIDKDLTKTDRLLDVLSKTGKIREYISGPKAKGYLEQEKFDRKGIKVLWHKYQCPYYNQNLWNSNIFISHLSIVDLIFHHGKDALAVILHKKEIVKPEGVSIVSPQAALGFRRSVEHV